VSEWLAEIVNQILFLGFFLALLENSVTWGQAIVDSFRQAASTAGGGGLAPSDVFTAGVDLAQKVMSQMSIWSSALRTLPPLIPIAPTPRSILLPGPSGMSDMAATSRRLTPGV
jgi:hypothetical protein